MSAAGNNAIESVYGPEAKRRKTEAEKAAELEKKKARQAELSSHDPEEPWELGQRQPWAEKTVKSAKPTEEQLAWLKAEGFIEEEEEGTEKVSFPKQAQVWAYFGL